MNLHTEPRDDCYDLVVIGSGLGGLSVAGLVARAGKKVLVVERHDRPGGYAHAFRRKGYLFDAAVHLVGGCEPTTAGWGGLIDRLLRTMGVREKCTFDRVDPFYTAMYPGMVLDARLGVDGFVDSLARAFPCDRLAIGELVRLCVEASREIRMFEQGTLGASPGAQQFSVVTRYHSATLTQVMDEYLTDARLKAAFGSLWPYAGLPPANISFLYWAVMLTSYLEEGAYYCRGSFQVMVNALVEGLNAHGGELLLRQRVRRVQVRNGRACGVVLENGFRVEAPVVISNADARQTFTELVGREHLPAAYVDALSGLQPSLSAFIVYVATSLDLRQTSAAHELFHYKSWDHASVYRGMRDGSSAGLILSAPTLTDPSLAPRGEHLLTATALVPHAWAPSWRADKARFTDRLLDEVEAILPGLRASVTFAEAASPRTLERYTLNDDGAMYGWEPSPAQAAARRLNQATPLPGLYLVGHWTQPGGGVYGVIASGVKLATRLLTRSTEAKLWGQRA